MEDSARSRVHKAVFPQGAISSLCFCAPTTPTVRVLIRFPLQLKDFLTLETKSNQVYPPGEFGPSDSIVVAYEPAYSSQLETFIRGHD